MDKDEEKTVAFRTRAAEDGLRKLVAQLETCSEKSSISIKAATDSFERFKLWAGNIGARQPANSLASLEARLTTAERILKQVHGLLHDLVLALDDLLDIASGSRENRRIIHENLISSDNSSPLEYQFEVEDDLSLQKNEFEDVLDVISDCVQNLLKISVLIRNATPRDRFARSLQSDNPFIDQFDINYVIDTFPKLRKPGSEWLCTRLGRAITRRRQFLRYSREHRSRLTSSDGKTGERSKPYVSAERKSDLTAVKRSGGFSIWKKIGGSITAYTHTSTKASTLNITALQRLREEDTRSRASYGSSLGVEDKKSRLHLPSLEKLSPKGNSVF